MRPLVLSFLVLLTVSASAAELQFDATGVTATGVTPGATTYWMCACLGTYNSVPLIAKRFAIVTDSDRDGVVRWVDAAGKLPDGLWTMVDGGNGSVTTRTPQGPMQPKPFPAKSLLRDEKDNYATWAFEMPQANTADGNPLYLFWVRPGVGAWHLTVADNTSGDENLWRDAIMVALPSLWPIDGSPATPATLLPGDVLLLMHGYAGFWLGDLVDAHLLETLGPGKVELGYYLGDEDAGITVKVYRLEGTGGAASVHIDTSDGTAISGTHYVARSGIVSFVPGQILSTFDVPVVDDHVDSKGVRFHVALSEPLGATLGSRTNMDVAIADNDDIPKVRVEALSQPEGNGGPAEVPVHFVLSHTAPVPARVEWKAADPIFKTTLATGVVDFAVGEKEKTTSLHYVADDRFGYDRLVKITMTNPTNCTPSNQASFSIIEDDPEPAKTVEGTAVQEDAGVARATIHFSAPYAVNYPLSWKTKDGTAKAGEDYVASSGTITIPAGAVSAVITVPIMNDSVTEPTETFDVEVTFVIGLDPVVAKVQILGEGPSRRRGVRH